MAVDVNYRNTLDTHFVNTVDVLWIDLTPDPAPIPGPDVVPEKSTLILRAFGRN